MKPIQNTSQTVPITVRDRVRVKSGVYNITTPGSEGIVLKREHQCGAEVYFRIDFYLLYPDALYANYTHGIWSLPSCDLEVMEKGTG